MKDLKSAEEIMFNATKESTGTGYTIPCVVSAMQEELDRLTGEIEVLESKNELLKHDAGLVFEKLQTAALDGWQTLLIAIKLLNKK